MGSRLERRDFLKIVGLGAVGLTAGGLLGSRIWEDANHSDKIAGVSGMVGREKLATEFERKISEIAIFRAGLGLKNIPSELTNLKGNKWEGESPSFENDLPNEDLSYGEYTEEVISKLFGENATRLVRGVRNNSMSPGAISFDPQDRFCNFSLDIHNVAIDGDFINYVLHEAGGHGSDPNHTNYSDKTLVDVEHGKWLALTQMYSIPGEFLNNPRDLMLPSLKKQLGKVVGKSYVENQSLNDLLDGVGQEQVGQTLVFIAGSQNKNVSEVKFNKRVCSEIGDVIIQLILKKTTLLKGALGETYASSMELGVSREIYAEMVRYAILYPEKVNGVVLDGISEVLTAIKGEPVDLDKLKEDIIHPSDVIKARNQAEAIAIMQTKAGQNVTVLNPKDIALMKEQQAETEKHEMLFQDFIKNGKLPDTLQISADQERQVKRYSELFLAMEQRFPGILSVDIIHDDRFDPDMNLWDIDDLAYALDQSFIRGLVRESTISEQMFGEIVKKVKILENLYNTAPYYFVYSKG